MTDTRGNPRSECCDLVLRSSESITKQFGFFLILGTCEPQICTADVIDVSRPEAVNISCKFTEATGYLLILSPQTDSSQEIFVVASKVNMSNSDWKISVPGVPLDNYAVFLYDLGSSGLPPLLSGDSTGGWRHLLL